MKFEDLTDTQYLKLLDSYQLELYGQKEENENVEEEFIYIPASDIEVRSMEKERKIKIQSAIIEDLSKASESEILEKIYSSSLIRIHEFLIRIRKYKFNQKESLMNVDIFRGSGEGSAYGFKNLSRHNFRKDIRFRESPLVSYFAGTSWADNLKIDQILEIVRWLQVMGKMSAFI